MPIAVTEDHESLRATALRWAQTHCPPTVPRQVAEAPPGSTDLAAAWEKMAAQGWLGLHVGEEHGGQGFTLAELAVVLEELGYALFPGPVLPTVLVSAALARVPHGPADVPPEWRRGLADGSITAAVALGAAPTPWQPSRRSRRSTPPAPWGNSPSAATARSRCRGAT
jgi:alkylation response protein AidB-like acyl-CoA dehydrogenase